MPNLAHIVLIKSYGMQQNATVGVKLPSPLLFKGFPAFYESG